MAIGHRVQGVLQPAPPPTDQTITLGTHVPDLGSLHILINHFPVILTIVGTAALLLAMIVRTRGSWLYATATLALAGVAVVPTFLTGDPAAEQLHDTWWVTREAIEAHSDAADFALWGLSIMGLIAAYAWWRVWRSAADHAVPALPGQGGAATADARPFRDGGLPLWLRALVLVSALNSCALVFRTASLGGDIVHHSEILNTTPRPASVPVPPAGPGER